MSRPLVRAVFAVLVVATIAAFFATQLLKSEFPLVIRFATKPAHFSPNADGYRDETRVGFDLSEPAEVTFSVVDAEGNEVRRIVDQEPMAGDAKHRFTWDGRDDEGNRVPDGTYRMRVVRRDESRVIDSFKEIDIDTQPPRARLVSAEPSVIAPAAPGQEPRVAIRYAGPANAAPEFRVFRTDDGPRPYVVRRFRGMPAEGQRKTREGVWNGEVSAGPDATTTAPDGDYAFTVTIRDRAGNPAVAPAEIPSPRTAAPRTGVSVRSFTLQGPLSVVKAGSVLNLEVGPVDRSFDFVLSRFGSPEALRSGGRVGGRFRVGVPKDAVTGLHLVRVRAGRQRAIWPVAVIGRPQTKAAGQRGPDPVSGVGVGGLPLLVLPALSWQGLNPEDDDGDGFADTLISSQAVRLDRPFAGGGFPPGFNAEVAPLLRWLERERLGYNLTTDISLARGEPPLLGDAPGIAFAGSELWLPGDLLRRLREYVAEGGKIASFGTDSFRRTVELDGPVARDPSGRRRIDAFGERTALIETSLAPLSVFEDELGLFAGLSDLVGEFTEFEVSRGLAKPTEALTTAGRDPGEPAFVAFQLGDGWMLRTGTAQWTGQLEEAALSVEVPQVTKRIWRRLGAR
jgi:FlgD Ig-like domain